MNSAEELLLDSMKHRDCAIRAASYEVGPQAWLPEACVWLQTEIGLRRVWIHSFAHCFAAEKLTFSSKLDADHWALVAAKSIIDRALDQSELSTSPIAFAPAKAATGIWKLARHPLSTLMRFKSFCSN